MLYSTTVQNSPFITYAGHLDNDLVLIKCPYSKEHCKMLCQRVHEREIYYQPARLGGDALTLHAMLERQAKVKCSLRQQPIGGPKIMFI